MPVRERERERETPPASNSMCKYVCAWYPPHPGTMWMWHMSTCMSTWYIFSMFRSTRYLICMIVVLMFD